VNEGVAQIREAAERESSLRLARAVQQRLFPAGAPPAPGFDIAGATFAADVTGGDYYDFVALPGDCLGILVADASGHGVDSALLMAETRAVLRATVQTSFEPSEILAIVNRVLHADTEAHRFVTLMLVILHLPSGSLAYSSAGHPAGYLLDPSGAVKSTLRSTGLPLGLFCDSVYVTRGAARMQHADTLVLLTDGVTDCGREDEEFFGADGALSVIRASLGASSSDLVNGLYRAVRAFEEGGPQRDDATTIVVRRVASQDAVDPPAGPLIRAASHPGPADPAGPASG
jgi:sigma-B regulation protein RsbU (phosphoserine phosphatase)